jgi:hypothetical protein
MRQRSEGLAVATRRGLTEITPAVRAAVRASGVREGHRGGSRRRQVAVHVFGE